MLEPGDRRLLLESLRPPEGYDLDFAIATTFTLDLLSLLTAPLGFTFFELDGDTRDASTAIDPLVLLRTIRRYAERIAIFCQAGRIVVPRHRQLLFANLEESVVQVAPSAERGVFHPKVWILRFVGKNAPVRYRLICLSRNLTFDRSWDTSLVLDGELVERKVGFGANRPLADFVDELPKLAIDRRLPARIREFVATAGDELRRVKFDPPPPFEKVWFWPVGIDGYKRHPIDGRIDRLLVISPFLSPSMVRSLGVRGERNVLVSRMDTLQLLSKEDLRDYRHIYAMDPSAGAELQGEDEQAGDNSASTSAGLHAKVYVADAGWDASVWTGSANATDAAFHQNVEFLVELIGKKSTCGIEALLGGVKDSTTLRDLLVSFEPLDTPVPQDAAQQDLESRLDALRRAIGDRVWEARVTDGGPGGYTIDLAPAKGLKSDALADVELRCWPITLADSSATRVVAGAEPMRFGPLTLEALTAFFAFEAEVRSGPASLRARFVVAARLIGAPAARRERLLQYHLRDSEQLIRFLLLLLLADDDSGAAAIDFIPTWTSAAGNGAGAAAELQVLLEPMLRALDGSPSSLDQVAETIAELRRNADGAALIPAGFDRIWSAVWDARQRLRDKSERGA
jgi:hypothetical protein